MTVTLQPAKQERLTGCFHTHLCFVEMTPNIKWDVSMLTCSVGGRWMNCEGMLVESASAGVGSLEEDPLGSFFIGCLIDTLEAVADRTRESKIICFRGSKAVMVTSSDSERKR